MDIYVLNDDLDPIAIVDNYTSLIWTKRYYTPGDFELYVPADKNLLEHIKQDYFIMRDDDPETAMIIEKIELKTSVEEGDFLIITGKSLESILSRRVIYNQTVLKSNVQTGIFQLINNNAIGPAIADRKITNLIVRESTDEITETINTQFTGGYLDEAITALCKQFEIGWKMFIEKKKFVFQLYRGKDTDVIFSPEFDNLISTDYFDDKTNLKNTVAVFGEGEGTARKKIWTGRATYSGLDRRELFVDARDLSSNDGEISATDYLLQLKARGLEKLAEYACEKSFEGEVAPDLTFSYKTDYDLGDVVTVENQYGISSSTRIIEIIENYDEAGHTIIPTFEKWEV